MGISTINIRLDDEDKKAFNELCNELGMNMSTAFNMFVKTMIRTGGIPFELKLSQPNELTKKVLAEAERGENLHGPYNTIEELMEALDA